MALRKTTSTPWAFRLGHKFFSVAPYRTTLIVGSSLVSQVSLLLAFLLPLKIVMLLGAESVPNYMPPPFDTMNHDTMIIVLSVLALASYVTHVLANRVTESASTAGTKRLIDASRKIVLFENQDTIASTAYRQYAEALSGLTFSALGLALLTWLYQEVAFIILTFAGIAAIATTIAAKKSDDLRHTLVDNAPVYVNAATGVGFFAVFVFIVIDFLVFTPPNFLVAIIAIILGRQLMTQGGLAVRNMAFLDKKEQKISALLFHDTRLDHQPQNTTLGVWKLLEKNQSHEWLRKLLEDNTETLLTPPFKIEWIQTNVRDVIALQVASPDKARIFIVKAFDRNKEAAALHEATLLVDTIDGLPSPPMVRVDTCEGFHCHVFDVTGLQASYNDNATRLSRDLANQLLKVRPSEELIRRYTCSKKMLWERLDHALIGRLRLVATPNENKLLDQFESALPSILKSLQDLPLRIVVQAPPANGLMFRNANQEPTLAHWTDWTLEPQGAGWPLTQTEDVGTIEKALFTHTSCDTNPTPNEVNSTAISASVHLLLSETRKQRYRSAFKWISMALALTDQREQQNLNEK